MRKNGLWDYTIKDVDELGSRQRLVDVASHSRSLGIDKVYRSKGKPSNVLRRVEEVMCGGRLRYVVSRNDGRQSCGGWQLKLGFFATRVIVALDPMRSHAATAPRSTLLSMQMPNSFVQPSG